MKTSGFPGPASAARREKRPRHEVGFLGASAMNPHGGETTPIPTRQPAREQDMVAMLEAMRRAGLAPGMGAGGSTRAILLAEQACGAGLGVARVLVEAVRDRAADDRSWRMAVAYPAVVCVGAATGAVALAAAIGPRIEAVALGPGAPGGHFGAAGTDEPGRILLAAGAVALTAATVMALALWSARRAWGTRRRRLRERTRACGLVEVLDSAGCPERERSEILSAAAAALPGAATFVGEAGRLGAFSRRLADAGRRRDRRVVPVIGSLVAGLAVLAYGFTLVRPVARLLERVASVPPADQWRPPR
jgi:hypothetical protein